MKNEELKMKNGSTTPKMLRIFGEPRFTTPKMLRIFGEPRFGVLWCASAANSHTGLFANACASSPLPILAS
jgi:hypothetical protein